MPTAMHGWDSRPLGHMGFDRQAMHNLYLSSKSNYSLYDDEAVMSWINERLKAPGLRAESRPIQDVEKWRVDAENGNISHESGRFFTILGIQVLHRTNHEERAWDQPILDQPEVGILGILAKDFGGVWHFCLQAKEEPGNINIVQMSPTVQATYSNYTRVHGGSPPPFLEFFMDPPAQRIIFSKLQSEDGGRFLFKSNRNMVVLAPDDAEILLPDGFIWLTLRQIGRLLQMDNMVNYCARSVLSCLI